LLLSLLCHSGLDPESSVNIEDSENQLIPPVPPTKSSGLSDRIKGTTFTVSGEYVVVNSKMNL
jgi:hypothetical protein